MKKYFISAVTTLLISSTALFAQEVKKTNEKECCKTEHSKDKKACCKTKSTNKKACCK